MLNNKTILVTGATGSFGREFVKTVYKQFPKIKKLIVFSRDELKQSEMSKIYSEKKYGSIRFFIGDVRDKERLIRASTGVDYIIHAAALKQVPAAEYNPLEFIKTNILGASNIIETAITCGVKKVIALSTDKAASPINLYGATKLCSDKLFIAANNYAGLGKIIFSVVRYGNVMNSRGSVIPHFLDMKKNNVLTITDKKMTRFNITLKEGVNFVLKCLKQSQGGEIFVPKLSSYKITDLAKAISSKSKVKIIGKRPGEKINEEMVTVADGVNSLEFKDHYIIFPNNKDSLYNFYKNKKNGKTLPENFSYNSRDNIFLSVSELKKLIKTIYV
jgi:UDP-N-acetylglucosamine 4,6-dehydratase/5-epimerase